MTEIHQLACKGRNRGAENHRLMHERETVPILPR